MLQDVALGSTILPASTVAIICWTQRARPVAGDGFNLRRPTMFGHAAGTDETRQPAILISHGNRGYVIRCHPKPCLARTR
jgi:hypothetical protein